MQAPSSLWAAWPIRAELLTDFWVRPCDTRTLPRPCSLEYLKPEPERPAYSGRSPIPEYWRDFAVFDMCPLRYRAMALSRIKRS